MRRIMMPGGAWILLAAAAVPILIKSAKPLAKKLGEGLRDVGDKLVEAATEPSEAKAGPVQPEPEPTKAKKPSAKPKTAASPASKPRARRRNPPKATG